MHKPALLFLLLLAIGVTVFVLLWSGGIEPSGPLGPGVHVEERDQHWNLEPGPLSEVNLGVEAMNARSVVQVSVEDEGSPPEAESNQAEEPADLVAGVATGTVHVVVHEAESNQPAKGALVELLDGAKFEGGHGWAAQEVTATDTDGEVWFRNVSAGPANVRLLAASPKGSNRNTTVVVKAGTTTEVTFEVDDTQHTRGYVVDVFDKRISGAKVWRVASYGPPEMIATSAEDGTFEVPYLGRTSRLTATYPGHVASSHWVVGIMGGQDDPAVLRLTSQRGRVFGRVIDEDGQGVPQAPLALSHFRGRGDPKVQNSVTAADGAFEFADAAVGDHTLEAKILDGALTQVEVSVTDGGSHELVVKLLRGGTVRGQVTSANRAPIQGAFVMAARPRYEALGQGYVRTDNEGRFEMRGQSPGETLYSVNNEHFREIGQATLTVINGQTTEWNPVAIDPTRLHGLVRSASGSPLKGWSVHSQPMRGPKTYPAWMTGRTDAEGRFDLTPPPGATYRIRVFAPGTSNEDFALEVEDIDPLTAPLDLLVPEDPGQH